MPPTEANCQDCSALLPGLKRQQQVHVDQCAKNTLYLAHTMHELPCSCDQFYHIVCLVTRSLSKLSLFFLFDKLFYMVATLHGLQVPTGVLPHRQRQLLLLRTAHAPTPWMWPMTTTAMAAASTISSKSTRMCNAREERERCEKSCSCHFVSGGDVEVDCAWKETEAPEDPSCCDGNPDATYS